jgi:hypothetical protein
MTRGNRFPCRAAYDQKRASVVQSPGLDSGMELAIGSEKKVETDDHKLPAWMMTTRSDDQGHSILLGMGLTTNRPLAHR